MDLKVVPAADPLVVRMVDLALLAAVWAVAVLSVVADLRVVLAAADLPLDLPVAADLAVLLAPAVAADLLVLVDLPAAVVEVPVVVADRVALVAPDVNQKGEWRHD